MLTERLLLGVFNALLEADGQTRARLRAFAGQCFEFRLSQPQHVFRLSITESGHVVRASATQPPGVILLAGYDFVRNIVAGGLEAALASLRIEGQADLAEVLSDLARRWRVDMEDLLATRLGDLPARRLRVLFEHTASPLLSSVQRLGDDLRDYVQHETTWLCHRANWCRLDARLAALETRLSRLP